MTGQSPEDAQTLHNSADFRVKFHRFLFYIFSLQRVEPEHLEEFLNVCLMKTRRAD